MHNLMILVWIKLVSISDNLYYFQFQSELKNSKISICWANSFWLAIDHQTWL